MSIADCHQLPMIFAFATDVTSVSPADCSNQSCTHNLVLFTELALESRDDCINIIRWGERSRSNIVMPADVADHPALVAELRERLQHPDGRVERDLQAGGESGLDTQTLERWLRADRQAESFVLKGHLPPRGWPLQQTD